MRKLNRHEIERGYSLEFHPGDDEYIKNFLTQCRILEVRNNEANYNYEKGHFEYFALDDRLRREVKVLANIDPYALVTVKGSYVSLKLEHLETKKHYVFASCNHLELFEVKYIEKEGS